MKRYIHGRRIVMEHEDRKESIVHYTLWFIWSKRNFVREEGRRRPAEIVARAIKIYVGEMGDPPQTQQRAKVQRVQRWTRPPEGHLKLNCDASFIPERKCGGWGFLIRAVMEMLC